MNKDTKNDDIITSQSLHDQVNAERKREGKDSLPEINAAAGMSSGNYARRDKSWNSVPGFFAKMFKGTGKEENETADTTATESDDE